MTDIQAAYENRARYATRAAVADRLLQEWGNPAVIRTSIPGYGSPRLPEIEPHPDVEIHLFVPLPDAKEEEWRETKYGWHWTRKIEVEDVLVAVVAVWGGDSNE